MSIGKFCKEQILANPQIKNDDLLALVKQKFEGCKTTYACIAWYKSDLRKKGLLAKRYETVTTVTDEQFAEMMQIK